jgi:hypothetical protein
MELKRDLVKYIRDKAKKAYNKTGVCEICGSVDGVDFHHYYSLTQLLDKWLLENKIEVTCVEDIVSIRDEFIAIHDKELYEYAANLCHKHHETLHRLYGQKPALRTAEKQMNWVKIQKDKYNG